MYVQPASYLATGHLRLEVNNGKACRGCYLYVAATEIRFFLLTQLY